MGSQGSDKAPSGAASPAARPSSASPPEYAQVPPMRASDPISSPSQAASDFATQTYEKMLKSSPRLVQAFEARFYAWQKSWYSISRHGSASARIRCDVPEFDELMEMGPRILPLVVYMLLDLHNFTAVFLYNDLEKDTRYLIDPDDVMNSLVLQRQSNLIANINQDRRW